jgi:hypothetical protein
LCVTNPGSAGVRDKVLYVRLWHGWAILWSFGKVLRSESGSVEA